MPASAELTLSNIDTSLFVDLAAHSFLNRLAGLDKAGEARVELLWPHWRVKRQREVLQSPIVRRAHPSDGRGGSTRGPASR